MTTVTYFKTMPMWRRLEYNKWQARAEKCPCRVRFDSVIECTANSERCNYDHCPFRHWSGYGEH